MDFGNFGSIGRWVSPVGALLGEDRLNKINKGVNDPWGQLMNPGKTAKSFVDTKVDLLENPTDIGSWYRAVGASAPGMPSPTLSVASKAGNQMQEQEQRRQNFDPYAGMPSSGGVTAAPNDPRAQGLNMGYQQPGPAGYPGPGGIMSNQPINTWSQMRNSNG